MAKKTYEVICTRIYNGSVIVQAESNEEAISIAREQLDSIDWDFGEQTADYAELLTNE